MSWWYVLAWIIVGLDVVAVVYFWFVRRPMGHLRAGAPRHGFARAVGNAKERQQAIDAERRRRRRRDALTLIVAVLSLLVGVAGLVVAIVGLVTSHH